MARSSQAEFDEHGFGAVVRDIEELFFAVQAGTNDGNLSAETVNSSEDGEVVNTGGGGDGEAILASFGAAGGDLTGFYPDPTIAKFQGIPLIIGGLSTGQFLRYNGASFQWENVTLTTPMLPIYDGTRPAFYDGLGGDTRGNYAVDWQLYRTATDRVASGFAAVVAGGMDNIASHNQAVVSGGFENEASGGHSTVIGGYQNVASAPYASVLGGFTNTASGWESIAGGNQSTAAGDDSIARGYTNSVTGDGGVAIGASNTVNRGYVLGANNTTGVASEAAIVGFGNEVSAGDQYIVGWGNGFGPTATNGALFGHSNAATGTANYAYAVGRNNTITSNALDSLALGVLNTLGAGANASIAIGHDLTVTANDCVVIGKNATWSSASQIGLVGYSTIATDATLLAAYGSGFMLHSQAGDLNLAASTNKVVFGALTGNYPRIEYNSTDITMRTPTTGGALDLISVGVMTLTSGGGMDLLSTGSLMCRSSAGAVDVESSGAGEVRVTATGTGAVRLTTSNRIELTDGVGTMTWSTGFPEFTTAAMLVAAGNNAITHKVYIEINGTPYYLLASTSSA
jgi:hypothetical protein